MYAREQADRKRFNFFRPRNVFAGKIFCFKCVCVLFPGRTKFSSYSKSIGFRLCRIYYLRGDAVCIRTIHARSFGSRDAFNAHGKQSNNGPYRPDVTFQY